MDLCSSLALFLFALAVVTVIGHLLWLGAAALFRGMFEAAPQEAMPARRQCPRCATHYAVGELICPRCRLLHNSPLARQLTDLDITARQVQELVDQKLLEAPAGEQVCRALLERQTELVGEKAARHRAAVDRKKALPPPLQRLEEMLSRERFLEDLSPEERRAALALYRQVQERDLGSLSPAALLMLVKLLKLGGLSSRALRAAEILVRSHPAKEETPKAIWEGARLAMDLEQYGKAQWFRERSREHDFPERIRPMLEDLWRSLPTDALPAEESPTEAVAPPVADGVSIPTPPPLPTEPEVAAEGRPGMPALAPTEVADVAPAPPPVAAPRRSWGQVLAAFMEEKNILWGELVGGLLIVGCSIALVISLWQTLEQIPYFPFLIFAAITAALFGAGFYTLSHWKLEATSRGLLVIGCLLTPLDFLILARYSRGREAGLLDVLAEVGSVAAFTFLVWRAGRVLLRETLGGQRAEVLLTVAVVGTAATQLLVPRWLDIAEPILWLFVLLSLLPVACQGVGLGLVWWRQRQTQSVSPQAAVGVLLFVGLSTFALAVAFGFLAYWSSDAFLTLRHLAVPIALACVPLVLSGGLLHDRLADAPAQTDERHVSVATLRLAGTVIGVTGMAFMLAALALAWPRPVGLVLIGVLNALVLMSFAAGYRLPAAVGPAVLCLAISYLTIFHLLTATNIEWSGRELLELFFAPVSGLPLLLFALGVSSLSEFMVRRDRHGDALALLVSAGVLALLALILLVPIASVAPGRMALALLLAAGSAAASNIRWRWPALTWAAALLGFGGVWHLLRWSLPGWPESHVWLFALLGSASVYLILSFILKRRAALRQTPWLDRSFGQPLEFLGAALSFLALAPLLRTLEWDWLGENALCWIWVGSLWLLLAVQRQDATHFTFFQLALLVAGGVALTSWLMGQEWVHEASDLWRRWGSWQVYILGLALYGLAWSLLRRLLEGQQAFKALLGHQPGVDQIAVAVMILAQTFLAILAILPPIAQELFAEARLDPAWLRLLGEPLDLTAAWLLYGVSIATLAAALWKVRGPGAVLLLIWAGLMVPVLAAQAFREERAAASALRWGLAIVFFLGSALLWARNKLRPLGAALFLRRRDERRWLSASRALLLAGALGPVLLLTWIVAMEGFQGRTPPGPLVGTLFRNMGWLTSMLVPLSLLAVTLTGHGVRENLAGYIFAAGLTVLATVTGGYALGLVLQSIPIGTKESVRIVQLMILTGSVWTLGWLASGRWRNLWLLGIHLGLPLVAILLMHAVAVLPLIAIPGGRYPTLVTELGSLLGWLALLAALSAAWWYQTLLPVPGLVHSITVGGLLIGVQCASSAARWEGRGWLGYHVLTLAWTVLGLTLVTLSWSAQALKRLGPGFWSAERRERTVLLWRNILPAATTRRWVDGIVVLIVFLALWGAFSDPEGPYWSAATVLAATLLLGAMAVWARRSGYVYGSGLLLCVLGYVLWHAWLSAEAVLPAWAGLAPGLFDQFLVMEAFCLLAGSALWTLLENHLRQRVPPIDIRGAILPFSQAALLLALHVLGMLILVAFSGSLLGLEYTLPILWTGLGLALAAGVLVLFLWDPEARPLGLPEVAWYAVAVLALFLGLHAWELPPETTSSRGAVLLAGFLLAASVIAWRGPRLVARAKEWGIPLAPYVPNTWFVITQAILGTAVLAVSVWACLELASAAERILGPASVALLILACVVLSGCWARFREDAPRLQRHLPQALTLILIVIAAIELAWALLGMEAPALWLHRLVLVLAVLLVLGGAYLSRLGGLLPQEGDWAPTARAQAPWWLALAAVNLLVILIVEFALYDAVRRTTPLHWSAVLLVAVLLAGVLCGTLWLAVARRNPLSLSPATQRRLVYSAETLLVVLLLHIRLNLPDLIPGILRRNWHFALMGLGFLGVGLGELFRRRNIPALAEPLHRTGLFLPLLPLLAYFLRPLGDLSGLGEAVPGFQPLLRYLHNLPAHFGVHALLWFLLAALYLTVSLLRRGTGWALLAAIAANFGLWVLLAHSEGLSFLLHPQVWLAPVGLILLAAEFLNRERLTKQQALAVRYAALLIIYLSSTADMFITGLGQSVLLPIVLALLSILGVLAGILLRVRAFLFMGMAFLFLVVFAQIWHAAVDRGQTWLWWASGIVLGAAILTLFALFEKKRNEVMRVIEEIKRWE